MDENNTEKLFRYSDIYGNWLMLEPKAVRALNEVYAFTEGHLLVTGRVYVNEGCFQA